MTNREQFGRWLKQRRQFAGLSMGLPRVQWGNIEAGKSGVRPGRIRGLAVAVRAEVSRAYRLAGLELPDDVKDGYGLESALAEFEGLLRTERDSAVMQVSAEGIIRKYLIANYPGAKIEGPKVMGLIRGIGTLTPRETVADSLVLADRS